MLDFYVAIDKVEGDRLYFKIKFENPSMVSIGSKKDMVVGTIIDEDFFCSSNSYQNIVKGT